MDEDKGKMTKTRRKGSWSIRARMREDKVEIIGRSVRIDNDGT